MLRRIIPLNPVFAQEYQDWAAKQGQWAAQKGLAEPSLPQVVDLDPRWGFSEAQGIEVDEFVGRELWSAWHRGQLKLDARSACPSDLTWEFHDSLGDAPASLQAAEALVSAHRFPTMMEARLSELNPDTTGQFTGVYADGHGGWLCAMGKQANSWGSSLLSGKKRVYHEAPENPWIRYWLRSADLLALA